METLREKYLNYKILQANVSSTSQWQHGFLNKLCLQEEYEQMSTIADQLRVRVNDLSNELNEQFPDGAT